MISALHQPTSVSTRILLAARSLSGSSVERLNMTWVELRHKAATNYIMALASADVAEIARFYEEGDRLNDMADSLIAQEDLSRSELA
jgi:hypothetical protein